MLNQIDEVLISYTLTYVPNVLSITFNIVLLVFAILICKRNSYSYGITLMLSSIISLASEIIYIFIQYPYLNYRLQVELGFPMGLVMLIVMTVYLVLVSLNATSAILLVVSIWLIYKTHKKDRID
ncbi:MAG TPA: hypothetical protein VMV43_00870 [Candidatus Nanopelagicaceae bacterium]|nr:hypothetical protein [Candidatus Nanopelagicaceae bacterium]